MSARPRRRTDRSSSNLDVTAFLSLMVILVPFLLITAVFSRMTILELEAASATHDPSSRDDRLALQVLVREQRIEVHYRGLEQPVWLAKTASGAERSALTRLLAELKARFPASSAATLLLEPQIAYDELVQIMDAVRIRQTRKAGQIERRELFPLISLGETPGLDQTAPGKN